MSVSTYTAAGGMILERKRLEAIARNLAGNGIPGYKREYVVSHVFDKQLAGFADENTSDYLGTSAGKVKIDHSQGILKKTDRPLDFVITGQGFFLCEASDGQQVLTRNGTFHLNSQRELVTAEGYRVVGRGGRIQFAQSDNVQKIQTTTDGYIRIRDDREGIVRDIAQFKIIHVPDQDKDKLIRLTANYYTVKPEDKNIMQEAMPFNENEKENPFNFEVCNGFQETSNSSPVKDMVAMVETSRDYEMNYKILKMLGERGKAEKDAFA